MNPLWSYTHKRQICASKRNVFKQKKNKECSVTKLYFILKMRNICFELWSLRMSVLPTSDCRVANQPSSWRPRFATLYISVEKKLQLLACCCYGNNNKTITQSMCKYFLVLLVSILSGWKMVEIDRVRHERVESLSVTKINCHIGLIATGITWWTKLLESHGGVHESRRWRQTVSLKHCHGTSRAQAAVSSISSRPS